MRILFKIIAGVFFLTMTVVLEAAQVGQIDTTNGIERVTVSRDGRLYAWDKQGDVISGWPDRKSVV